MASVGESKADQQPWAEQHVRSPAHEFADDTGSLKEYLSRRLSSFMRAQLFAGVVTYCVATLGHLAIEPPKLLFWVISAPAAAMALITIAIWRSRSSGLLGAACVLYVLCAEIGVILNALSWTDGIKMALPFFVLIPLVAAVVLPRGWDFALTSMVALCAPLALISLHPETPAMRIYYTLYMSIAVAMSVVTNIFAVRFYQKNYRYERQLRAFADIDELTQLPRRRRVIELAKRILQRCERSNVPVCVLYLDADRFKSINDIFGHDAGDRALTLIATQIQEAVRPADVAGRFGGEEFIVFLPGADLNMATKIGERLRKRIEGIKNFEAILTVSIGVAQHVKGHDIHHVIQAADGALLRAKRAGRNCVTVADTPTRVHGLAAGVTDHAAQSGGTENDQNTLPS